MLKYIYRVVLVLFLRLSVVEYTITNDQFANLYICQYTYIYICQHYTCRLVCVLLENSRFSLSFSAVVLALRMILWTFKQTMQLEEKTTFPEIFCDERVGNNFVFNQRDVILHNFFIIYCKRSLDIYHNSKGKKTHIIRLQCH